MYNIKRSLLGLATIIGITSMIHGTPQPHLTIQPRPERKRKGAITRRVYARRSYNKYVGVQSERECVRRIGGQAQKEFLARDRVRRGLPAQK